MTETISVILTVLDGMPFLEDSVQSILNQTHSDLELLIVNDGSTDGTASYIDSLTDARVRVIHLRANGGRAAALNVAFGEARFPWVAIQDADDLSLPNRLETLISFASANPQYSLITCGWGYVGTDNRPLRAVNIPVLKSPPEYDPMIDGAICNTGSMMRREAVLDVGGYRDVVAEDLDLWLRLDEASCKMASIAQVLVLHRVLPSGITSRNLIRQRVSWAYSMTCSRARRAGREEPSFDEFSRAHWPRGFERLRLEGQRQFRLAGASWAARNRAAALARLIACLVLNPMYVIRKAKLYYFNGGRSS